MKKAFFFCILLLLALYGVRYWLQQQESETETQLVLKIREGTRALQESLQSPEFRKKVAATLKDKQIELTDEAREQWLALKQIAQDGLVRLKDQDVDVLRDVAQAVSEEARSEGRRITFEESKLTSPPAHWMVAAVTNLILLAWISLAVFVLWGIARFLARNRQGEE